MVYDIQRHTCATGNWVATMVYGIHRHKWTQRMIRRFLKRERHDVFPWVIMCVHSLLDTTSTLATPIVNVDIHRLDSAHQSFLVAPCLFFKDSNSAIQQFTHNYKIYCSRYIIKVQLFCSKSHSTIVYQEMRGLTNLPTVWGTITKLSVTYQQKDKSKKKTKQTYKVICAITRWLLSFEEDCMILQLYDILVRKMTLPYTLVFVLALKMHFMIPSGNQRLENVIKN